MRKTMWPFIAAVLLGATTIAHAAPVTNADAAVHIAQHAIQKYHLLSGNPECLGFIVDNEKTAFIVRVVAPASAACGGNGLTEPTLFFLKVRKADGQVTTTSYGTDGSFQPLKPAPQPGS